MDRQSQGHIIIKYVLSPRTWLGSGRDRVSHLMPVDVFGGLVDAGSAPRGQVSRKGQDCCVARRTWTISFFVFVGCIRCIRMGRVVVKAPWERTNCRHPHTC